MFEQLINICEVTAIAITVFLVKKYVLLGPSFPPKKQRIFYLISAAAVTVTYLLFGKDAATAAIFVSVVLNIVLAVRKGQFCTSAFMMLFSGPGIINGLYVPLLQLPPYLFSFSGQDVVVWQLGVYVILFLLLVVFYFKGKKWRQWFEDNAKGRSLSTGEQILLSVFGILMLAFSSGVSEQTVSGAEHAGEISFFMAISGLTAFVMTITIIVLVMQGNKRTYYHRQFSEMQFNIITMMADIVENRDDNTGGHIKRTAKYVKIIADELKKRGEYSDVLTDKYISDMIVAAPLHDIGKIHISDTILNKPGRLTDEEFEIMKTHTTAGEKLLIHAKDELGESSYLDMAIEMAAYHHEWWNGKGYPYNIKENEIPLCARIMAVADVFDALTAKRCYKNAMPMEKAVSIIREETGTHFDPIVSEAFLSAVDKIDLS